ncbi:hypothetical protein B0T10DRAFT_415763 [Thelonectria olida]|uniref:Uncharacterized protein n=1 Tax=Thelonectria olida TaxID=1576542 RepID=A0A9P9AIC0_9HYPO|nr:hypothetical protein B0T10DRAFT_415763 [Thelonectria olida]
MDNRNPNHICLRVQCGICGWALLPGDAFVPLRDGDTSPEAAPCSDKAHFPGNGDTNLAFHDSLLCWRLKCWRCNRSPEAVGVHYDCFVLFKNECTTRDALDRLWMVAVSRSPWRGALDPGLDHDANLAVDLVYEKAEVYGIPELRALPAELIRLIRDYSEAATFWRYICATSLGRELARSSADSNSLSTPLSSISGWARGGEPVISQPEDSSLVRLAFDSRGIKQIERISSRPTYQHRRSDNLAYAIHEESQLRNATANFKYRILRLELPKSLSGFQIWDMPSPPSLEDCGFCGHIAQSTRFRTADLHGATGLTFFFSHGKVYAIHAHTATEPDSRRTFERISKRQIIAFGVRVKQAEGRVTAQKPCFAVRTKLAGDVFIGPCHTGQHRDMVLSQSQPRLLIYNTADFGPATIFGAYSWERHANRGFAPFEYPQPDKVLIQHANFSSAPLNGVTTMRVFYDQEKESCRAILFDYENGARRAVGSCRLGIDLVATYVKPVRICRFPSTYLPIGSGTRRQGVRIVGGCDGDTDCHGTGWVCSEMEGVLEFWSLGPDSAVRIHTGTEEQPFE